MEALLGSFKKVVDIADKRKEDQAPHKLIEPFLNNIEINEFLLQKKQKKFSHFHQKPKSMSMQTSRLQP